MFSWLFSNNPYKEYTNVNFGIFNSQIYEYNNKYNNICKRIKNFVDESGKDKYNRKADCEEFLFFIIIDKLYNEPDMDMVYKKFVEYKLNHNNEKIYKYGKNDFIYIK